MIQINTETNQFKNYKKILLPDLDELREQRNKNKLNSFIEVDDLGLNKKSLSYTTNTKINDDSDNNISRAFNQSIDNENLINASNDSFSIENTKQKANNWKKYFNIDDDFDFEEKENKIQSHSKENLLNPKDLNKFKFISNKNYNTQQNSNDIKLYKDNNNLNNSVNYANKKTVETQNFKNNIYLDKLNDQEYERIYEKKNKSFNNFEDNNSDLSNSYLSGRINSPKTKKISENLFKEENYLSLIREDEKVRVVNQKNELSSKTNKFEINKDDFLKRTGSKIIIEQNKIFDDNDEFEKILSKPLIIENKIKDKFNNPHDLKKKKNNLNQNEVKTSIQNNNFTTNSNFKEDLIKENMNKTYLGQINRLETSENNAIVLINSRIKDDNPNNFEEYKINKQIFKSSDDSNNNEYNFSFHKSENISLIDENNKNDDIDHTNRTNLFLLNSNKFVSPDGLEMNDVLSDEKILDVYSNDKKGDFHINNIKSGQINNTTSQMKINKEENLENEMIEFDNFSLGYKKFQKVEAMDPIKSYLNINQNQKAQLKNKIFATKIRKEENIVNNIHTREYESSSKRSNGVFRDDLFDDW